MMRKNKTLGTLKKENIREQLTEALDLPKEVVINLPVITLTGNKEINIENFSGLLEYTSQKIRLNTRSGIVVIDGINLEARNMTAEKICIKGNILHVSFVI